MTLPVMRRTPLVALVMSSAFALASVAASASAAPPRPGVEGAGESLQWTELTPHEHPTYAFLDLHAAYDPAGHEIVLYEYTEPGGAETWVWTGESWQHLVIPRPPRRFLPALAEDPAHDQVVLFGGDLNEGDRTDETWVYADRTWAQLDPATRPSARYAAAMAYDPILGQVLLFGGEGSGELGDTWSFDGTTWHELHPGRAPFARADARLAYDPHRGKLVMFSGFTYDGPASEGCEPQELCYPTRTWAWNGSTWRPLHLARSPSGRHEATLMTVGHRLVLFGGAEHGRVRGDTWVLRRLLASGPSRLAAPAVPGRRGVGPLGRPSDLVRGYTMFGDHLTPIDDTWALTSAQRAEVVRPPKQ